MAQFSKDMWTVSKIRSMYEYNELGFDNPVQRKKVWNNPQKSKLIDSILRKYPMGQVFEVQTDDYSDIIDGQQRITTILDFINDEFKFSIQSEVKLKDGTKFNLFRKSFSQLPKEIQDTILDYNVDVVLIQNVTDGEISELFDRLNGGKALTNIEKTKAKSKSLNELVFLSKHPIFDIIMDETGKNKSNHFGYVIQSYAILFNQNKCLLNKKIEQILKDKTILKEEQDFLLRAFDIYVELFSKISGSAKAYNKMKKKVHFVSLLPVLEYVINNNVSVSSFVNWVVYFFNSEYTTISEAYNENLIAGINTDTATRSRTTAALNNFTEFLNADVKKYYI